MLHLILAYFENISFSTEIFVNKLKIFQSQHIATARHVWCPFRFDPHLVSEGWPHLLMMKFWTTISPHSLHWLGLAAGTTSKNVLPPPRLHGDEDDGCKILCHRILPKAAETGVPMHSLFWLTAPHSGNMELDHARLSRDLAAVAQFHSNSVSQN